MSENVGLLGFITLTDKYKLQLNSYDKLWCTAQYQVLHLAVQNFRMWSSDLHFIYSTQIQHRPITAWVIVIKYIKVTSKATVHLGHDTVPLGNWFCFQRTVIPSSSRTGSGPRLHTRPHSHFPDWPINLSSQSWFGHIALRCVPLPVLSGILLKALDPLRWWHYGPLKCWETITPRPKRTEDSKI